VKRKLDYRVLPELGPRLVTFWFGQPDDNYGRMARVLEFSAAKHCPGWSIEVNPLERKPVPHYHGAPDNFIYNVQKVDAWKRAIVEAPDGSRICVMDSDMMITGPLDDVWAQDFDVAYTGQRGKLGLNAGVLFVRVSKQSRRFVCAWADKNHEMLESLRKLQEWKRRTPGMTQPALMAVLNSPVSRTLRVLNLPCRIWNCEDVSWPAFGKHVKILHIKGRLRQAVFGGAPSAKRLRLDALAKMWHETEARMMGMAEGETA
jgi:hypothetical protein